MCALLLWSRTLGRACGVPERFHRRPTSVRRDLITISLDAVDQSLSRSVISYDPVNVLGRLSKISVGSGNLLANHYQPLRY